MANTKDILYLVGITGDLLRNLSRDADWTLEEVKGSTNRLTVEIPLSDGFGVATDQEILFRGKRYIIAEVSRYRGSSSVTIYADEAQVELSDRNIKKFSLNKTNLSNAITKAVEGSKWTVGTVFNDTKQYFAELENKSSLYCLTFLESQSGGKLVFDSVKRTVNMEKVDTNIAPDKVLRYKKNVDDISKTEIQPQATILYPYGQEKMSIASVNGDLEYIEDFSWYESLGVPLEEAKKKYSKEYVWEDERYIYPVNLLNDAKNKLATLSHPQINYTVKASVLEAENLSLDESIYVVDDELGIKLKTVVSKLKICKDPSENEIELDYLPASLSDLFNEGTTGDSSGTSGSLAIFQVKNPAKVTLNTTPSPVLTSSINVYTNTHFEAGLSMILECTTAGLVEGYFMLDGAKLPTQIKQTVGVGWHTIGLPFVVTMVTEGSKNLDLYLSTTGAVTIEAEQAEMFIKSQGAYGGSADDGKPDRRVVDDIEMADYKVEVNDAYNITFEPQVNRLVMDVVALEGGTMDITENVSITFK